MINILHFEAVLYFKQMDALSFGTTTENSSVPGTNRGENNRKRDTILTMNTGPLLGEGKINVCKGKNIPS